MATGPIPKLIWAKIHIDYKPEKVAGQGCVEGFDMLEPTTITAPNSAIEQAAENLNELAKYRAALLPEGCSIPAVEVGYYGKPSDSILYATSPKLGLISNGAFRFDRPNDPETSVHFSLATVGGRKSSYWLRCIPDSVVVDSFAPAFGSWQVLKGNKPALPAFANSNATLLDKWIEALLFFTVSGRVNPVLLQPNPPNGTLPFDYDDWRRANWRRVSKRKMGKPYGQKAGRSRAGV